MAYNLSNNQCKELLNLVSVKWKIHTLRQRYINKYIEWVSVSILNILLNSCNLQNNPRSEILLLWHLTNEETKELWGEGMHPYFKAGKWWSQDGEPRQNSSILLWSRYLAKMRIKAFFPRGWEAEYNTKKYHVSVPSLHCTGALSMPWVLTIISSSQYQGPWQRGHIGVFNLLSLYWWRYYLLDNT